MTLMQVVDRLVKTCDQYRTSARAWKAAAKDMRAQRDELGAAYSKLQTWALAHGWVESWFYEMHPECAETDSDPAGR